MSLLKHFGEQGEEHGGRLFWSNALGGVPFRGPYAPTLSQEEIDSQVSMAFDFHSEVFDLSDPDQHKRFSWVMDRIINRWFCLHHIDRQMIPAQKTVIVYLEWSQRYGELSPAARAARSQNYAFPTTNDATRIIAGLQPSTYGQTS